jgi:hypothetical protein
MSFLRRHSTLLLLTALCCFPLFFLNVKDSHDWGDDFAQYLMQAENVVKGIPQTQTQYVFDDRFPTVAPPAYPMGFPLLLAPAYALWGHSIYHYDLLITAVLFLLCLLMAVYFRRQFSTGTSLVLVLLFAYGYWTLDFKTNILSDLPFSLLFLLAVMLYRRRETTANAVFTGLAAGMLLLFRGAGILFPAAVVLHSAWLFWRRRSSAERKSIVVRLLLITGLALGVSFLVNRLYGVPNEKFLSFYRRAVTGSTGDSLIQNLNYYVEVFKAFFQAPVDRWTFAPSVAASASLVLLLAGMVVGFLRHRRFDDLLAGLYIALFLVYPYGAGGFRFILPLVPFLFVYMGRGMNTLLDGAGLPVNTARLVITALLILLYRPGVLRVIDSRGALLDGPQQPASQEMFSYLSTHCSPSDVVLFIKPKALALYTPVRTCSTVHTQQPAEVEALCRDLHVRFLLRADDPSDSALERFLAANPDRVAVEWQNSRFTLLRLQR